MCYALLRALCFEHVAWLDTRLGLLYACFDDYKPKVVVILKKVFALILQAQWSSVQICEMDAISRPKLS